MCNSTYYVLGESCAGISQGIADDLCVEPARERNVSTILRVPACRI